MTRIAATAEAAMAMAAGWAAGWAKVAAGAVVAQTAAEVNLGATRAAAWAAGQ